MWCMAINSAHSIFWSPGSLYATLRFLKGLYIPYPIFFSFPMLLGYFFGWYMTRPCSNNILVGI